MVEENCNNVSNAFVVQCTYDSQNRKRYYQTLLLLLPSPQKLPFSDRCVPNFRSDISEKLDRVKIVYIEKCEFFLYGVLKSAAPQYFPLEKGEPPFNMLFKNLPIDTYRLRSLSI